MKKYVIASFVMASSAGLFSLWYLNHGEATGPTRQPVAVEQLAQVSKPKAKAKLEHGAPAVNSPEAFLRPPAPEDVVTLEHKPYTPDRAEHLQRSRAHIERTVRWLSERRETALRDGRVEEGALLALRLTRLNGRLGALRRGEDPDGAMLPKAPEARQN